MSQSEIAYILGVNQSNVAKWEKGSETIPLKKLIMYANYFDVSLDNIIGLTTVKEKPVTSTEINPFIIGKMLREFRKEINMTQEGLAKQLNTTHSTISAYDSGKTVILTSFAYQICKKYNISMDYLCGKTDKKSITL